MTMCPECNTEVESHSFNGKEYFYCTKCQKEIIIGDGKENSKEEITMENEEYKEEEETIIGTEEDKSEDDYNRKEKVKKILTPDVITCKTCIDDYREDVSCSKCDIVMLKPDYNGRVYECPICGKLYCENCWEKTE